MKIYRAAVVGCGRIASEFDEDPKRKYVSTHAKAYTICKRTNLVSVCDLDGFKLKKCAERWSVPSLYKDYHTMLKNEKIDILSICTPAESHFSVLEEAVKYKVKAIFCEKPIAKNLSEAEEMISLCHENKIILQIDHQRRFDRNVQKVKDYILKGRLGNIQQVTFYYTAGIVNSGSHMFDLMLFLFGKAEWIIGLLSNNSSLKPNDPNIDGMIRFKSGLTTVFQAHDASKFLLFDLIITGSSGRIKVLRSGFELEYYKVKNSDLFSGYKELYKDKPPFSISNDRNLLLNAVSHLIDCIEDKKESISSGNDGKMALGLIEAAMLSAKNNGKKILL